MSYAAQKKGDESLKSTESRMAYQHTLLRRFSSTKGTSLTPAV